MGDYKISIIASAPIAFMNPVYSEEQLVELKVMDACPDDEISVLNSIDNKLYNIVDDGNQIFTPIWEQKITDCPKTYEVKRLVDGSEQPLTVQEASILV